MAWRSRQHTRAAVYEAIQEGLENLSLERRRAYSYDELVAHDKVSLDIFWLRDELLEDTANLPDPDVLAAEIVEHLQAALEQLSKLARDSGE